MRSGIRLAISFALVAACEQERAPLYLGFDADAPIRDASVPIFDSGYQRPETGPSLPGSDRQVLLPFGDNPVRVPLRVEAVGVQLLDIFFSIDTTGSFGGEIDTLQRTLQREVVPQLEAEVGDVAIGVGRFEDFPRAPFGAASDRPFERLTPITTDFDRVEAALGALDRPLGLGGDIPESGAEALYQIATGAGYSERGQVVIEPFAGGAARGGGTLGGVGYRQGALHIVIHATDAPSHEPQDYGTEFPGTRSYADAVAALGDLDAHVIGIASSLVPRRELEALAVATDAVVPAPDGMCATGLNGASRPAAGDSCPLVFDIGADGAGLSDALVTSIRDLIDTIVWDRVWGEADDPYRFVQSIDAVEGANRLDLRAPSGVDDTFVAVESGQALRFELVLENRTLREADYEQTFLIEVRIVTDRLTLLSETIRVTIPRRSAGP